MTESIIAADGIELDATWQPVSGDLRGAVLLVHGINANKDEGGMYRRLAEYLASQGLASLRFSFRGHGDSEGQQRGATVSGEMLDLWAAMDSLTERVGPGHPIFVVSSSFGTVATGLLLPFLKSRYDIQGLVLWNPVLDVAGTFVCPRTPWARENFTKDAYDMLDREGYMLLDGEFEVGRVLADEMGRLDPRPSIASSGLPLLIIHGDADRYVDYHVSATFAAHAKAALVTIAGSDHGFDEPSDEATAVRETASWIGKHIAA